MKEQWSASTSSPCCKTCLALLAVSFSNWVPWRLEVDRGTATIRTRCCRPTMVPAVACHPTRTLPDSSMTARCCLPTAIRSSTKRLKGPMSVCEKKLSIKRCRPQGSRSSSSPTTSSVKHNAGSLQKHTPRKGQRGLRCKMAFPTACSCIACRRRPCRATLA